MEMLDAGRNITEHCYALFTRHVWSLAAQIDELVAGAAAQLPGAERALCTRRSLYHVLLALEEDSNALMLDGEDIRFCV